MRICVLKGQALRLHWRCAAGLRRLAGTAPRAWLTDAVPHGFCLTVLSPDSAGHEDRSRHLVCQPFPA